MTTLNRSALIALFPNEELEKLTEINLGWKYISKIDKNTFQNLTNLIKLELNNNNLEELDPSLFDDLLNLHDLRLDGNKLKQLDDKIFSCTNTLRQLYLYNNQLKEITSELFSQLSELKIIRLKNNGLQRIHKDAFKNLIKLEELSFRDNQIAELDNELFNNTFKLSDLYMYNNKIKILPSDLLKNLRKLTLLEINSNEIVEIPAGFFSNQTLLRVLNLGNNRLQRINSNTFEGLYNLELLSLNNNRIIDIDKSAFLSLSKLRLLQLNGNKLRKVDPNCFSCLKSIEAIQLYDNYMPGIQCFDNSSGQLISDSLKQRKDYRFLSNWEDFLQQFYELNINQSDSDLTVRNIEDPYIGKILKTRYEIISKLGKGSFGNVYLVKDLNHGVNKAIKIMDKLDISTLNELNILWKINHEYLIKYYDHFDLNTSTRSYMCLVTEYCDNGDLKRQIKKAKESNRHFTDDEILIWMCQATNALKFLHSNDIIHRDIKPENMLLTKENVLKLADLGIAKLTGSSTANTCVGTLFYMSPEIFESQFRNKSYSANTDIWSLGCVLYELIFHELAFPQGQKNSPSIPHFNSCTFSSILSKMLVKDPEQRIDSNSLYDLFENMK